MNLSKVKFIEVSQTASLLYRYSGSSGTLLAVVTHSNTSSTNSSSSQNSSSVISVLAIEAIFCFS